MAVAPPGAGARLKARGDEPRKHVRWSEADIQDVLDAAEDHRAPGQSLDQAIQVQAQDLGLDPEAVRVAKDRARSRSEAVAEAARAGRGKAGMPLPKGKGGKRRGAGRKKGAKKRVDPAVEGRRSAEEVLAKEGWRLGQLKDLARRAAELEKKNQKFGYDPQHPESQKLARMQLDLKENYAKTQKIMRAQVGSSGGFAGRAQDNASVREQAALGVVESELQGAVSKWYKENPAGKVDHGPTNALQVPRDTSPAKNSSAPARSTWFRRREAEKAGFIYNPRESAEENEERFQESQRRYKKRVSEARRDRWTKADLSRGITGRLARRPGPIGAFVATVRLLGDRARLLTILLLTVGLLFVPLGVFTFAGWSIAALAMVIVSAIYFVLLNGVKLIASLYVAAFNAAFAFVGGGIVRVTEAVAGMFSATEVGCGFGEPEVTSTFCSGRRILAEGLVPASELRALAIPLLDPKKLMPEPSSTTLIEWIGQKTGLYNFSFGIGDWFSRIISNGAESNIYIVVAAFAIPTIFLGWLAYVKVVKPAMRAGGVA